MEERDRQDFLVCTASQFIYFVTMVSNIFRGSPSMGPPGGSMLLHPFARPVSLFTLQSWSQIFLEGAPAWGLQEAKKVFTLRGCPER
jgi:hypothetical protein